MTDTADVDVMRWRRIWDHSIAETDCLATPTLSPPFLHFPRTSGNKSTRKVGPRQGRIRTGSQVHWAYGGRYGES
jgi:hypothetical protein